MHKHSRRIFLRTAGAGALAAAAFRSKIARAESGGTCPLSFGTYGLPGFSLEESIRCVSQTGFDAIEIAAMPGYHGAPDELTAARRAEVRKLLADAGLRVGALMGLPFPDKEESKCRENLDWVRRLVELANDLSPGDPPIIQSVLGGGKWDEKKTIFRDRLGSWLESASVAGVKLAIKPHRGHAMSRPEEAVWLIEQLNAAGKLSLVYDFSHYAFRDLKLEDTVAAALPHTGYLVMKDAVEMDGKVRFKLPGETGEMPHARILKLFYEGGYRGEVCCEVSSQVWRAEGYDAKDAAKTCYVNMDGIFSEAGVPRLTSTC